MSSSWLWSPWETSAWPTTITPDPSDVRLYLTVTIEQIDKPIYRVTSIWHDRRWRAAAWPVTTSRPAPSDTYYEVDVTARHGVFVSPDPSDFEVDVVDPTVLASIILTVDPSDFAFDNPDPEFDVALVTITWQDNSDNEDGFSLERRIDGHEWGEIAFLDPNTEFYEDNPELGFTYQYRLKATSEELGDSEWTPVREVTV